MSVDIAVQEAFTFSKRLADAEEDAAKLRKVRQLLPLLITRARSQAVRTVLPLPEDTVAVQEMKQKSEYTFSLTSQVEAKKREAQQHEKEARDSKADALRLARELEDRQMKMQVCTETEIGAAHSLPGVDGVFMWHREHGSVLSTVPWRRDERSCRPWTLRLRI